MMKSVFRSPEAAAEEPRRRRRTLISWARLEAAASGAGVEAQALACAAAAILAFRYTRSAATITSGSGRSARTFRSRLAATQAARDVPGLFAGTGLEAVSQVAIEGERLPYSDTPLAATLRFARTEPTVTIEYSGALEERFAERMLGHLETILAALVAGTDATVATIPFLEHDELRRTLVTWNATLAHYARDATLHELFEQTASRRSGAVALSVAAQRLTYGELNEESNRLAHFLIGEGIGRETRVGICLPRNESLVIALLAVLKAGGAYVPLDPQSPPARLALILQDADPALILSVRSLRQLPGLRARRVIEVDASNRLEFSSGNPIRRADPHDAAYVMYTSGSTGTPKGAVIEHRSLSAFMAWTQRAFSPQELSGVLFASSATFDVSVFELFAPLCAGGCSILVDDILALPNAADRNNVTLVAGTASGLATLIDTADLPPSVTTIMQAGEFLHSTLANALVAHSGVRRVMNLCGATEDTIYSVAHEFSEPGRGHPPIGKPIENREAYVLDEYLQPVPVGFPGEIYYSGAGLAREYLNDPGLTARRFVPNPFPDSPYPRLYRSGDIARHREDGALEYLARADEQLKIRGYRVELGEIEAQLAKHRDIASVAVVPRGKAGASPTLTAFAVLRSGASLSLTALRAFAESALPAYMIPTSLVIVPHLPSNASGKVDRRALADFESGALSSDAVAAPPTALESELARLWCEQLGIEHAGPQDDFFVLGGHSLVAVRLIARLRKRYGIALELREFLADPRIAAVARRIQRARGSAPA